MKTYLLIILIFSLVVCFLNIGCENDYPTSNEPGPINFGQAPIINNITPDSAFAGVDILKINGANFSTEPHLNHVWFDKEKVDVLSASETELEVKAPNIISDTVKIKVGFDYQWSDPFFYKLIAAVSQFGALKDDDFSSAIASDLQGNVYVSVKGAFKNYIKKIMPNGVTEEYAETTFLNANGMKVGPDNILYAAVAAGRRKLIQKIDTSGVESTFATLQIIPKDLDFDEDKNLWVVGRQSTTTLIPCDILRIKPNGTQETMKTYQAYLQTVRVYNDNGNTYVYVAGYNETTSEQKIWRSQIQPDGTLGTDEVVLDIAAASWLSGIKVQMITFSQDGKIYMGTNGDPNAMFIYDPQTFSNEILYTGLIGRSIYDIIWGEGELLFAVQQPTENSSNILRIDTRTLGAIYYGRQP